MRYNTVLLDTVAWDLVLDNNGNIALAQPPYALAQDVASAQRLFSGELWYDTTKGVPYFGKVLGKLPPTSLMQTLEKNAALTVPGVVKAKVLIAGFANRRITGQTQFVDEAGITQNVQF